MHAPPPAPAALLVAAALKSAAVFPPALVLYRGLFKPLVTQVQPSLFQPISSPLPDSPHPRHIHAKTHQLIRTAATRKPARPMHTSARATNQAQLACTLANCPCAPLPLRLQHEGEAEARTSSFHAAPALDLAELRQGHAIGLEVLLLGVLVLHAQAPRTACPLRAQRARASRVHLMP